MTTAAWFHCFAGIAGDMALGSLIDAGADIDQVIRELRKIEIDGWHIPAQVTQRCGLRATHLVVHTGEDGHHHRDYADIRSLIDRAALSPRVKQRAQNVFLRLAEAEAHMHDTAIDAVHFHEVGGIDAIVDIVGTCIALDLLGVDEVFASPITTGTGTVRAAHGVLPVPVPAVARLLHGVPTRGGEQPFELTTPTGAALMTALCEAFGPTPAFDPLHTSGYGAGTRDIEGLPNVTQVLIGTLADRHPSSAEQPLTVLEANVDDVTGEVLAYVIECALTAGANDAWITPIIMKKGRPAYTVHALVDEACRSAVADVLVRESGTLGLRSTTVARWAARREFTSVASDGDRVGVKTAAHRAKAEFEDAAAIARATGRPLREVLAQAVVPLPPVQ